MHKSSSFTLLNGDGLQNRWRQTSGVNFIKFRKNKFRFSLIYVLATILLLLIIYISLPTSRSTFSYSRNSDIDLISNTICANSQTVAYNSAYPLTTPLHQNHHSHYRIGLIADLDTNSKTDDHNQFRSYYKKGYLQVSATQTDFNFKWDSDDAIEINSGFALKGKFYITTLL